MSGPNDENIIVLAFIIFAILAAVCLVCCIHWKSKRKARRRRRARDAFLEMDVIPQHQTGTQHNAPGGTGQQGGQALQGDYDEISIVSQDLQLLMGASAAYLPPLYHGNLPEGLRNRGGPTTRRRAKLLKEWMQSQAAAAAEPRPLPRSSLPGRKKRRKHKTNPTSYSDPEGQELPQQFKLRH